MVTASCLPASHIQTTCSLPRPSEMPGEHLDLALFNALALIYDIHSEQLLLAVERGLDPDDVTLRKLESVLDHIDQNLLEASAVTDKLIWQRIFNLLQFQTRTLELRLFGEHVQHKIEGVTGRESLPSHLKFTLVQLDKVQHVSNLTEKQID